MAKRKTVNGLKLIEFTEESICKKIKNAGDLEDQVKMAKDLKKLDIVHYQRVIKAIRLSCLIGYALFSIGLIKFLGIYHHVVASFF